MESSCRYPELSSQFSRENLSLLVNGRAPVVPVRERVGRRRKFEIHHQKHISEGGAVYDIENLQIVTPKLQIEIHSGVNKYEQ